MEQPPLPQLHLKQDPKTVPCVVPQNEQPVPVQLVKTNNPVIVHI